MMRTTTTLLLAIVLLASCNQYQKTPSGLLYKITKGGSTQNLKQGQYVKFNIEFKVPPKDSIFSSSYGVVPAYLVVDTARQSKHSFLEIMTKLAVGDKAEFVMSVDTLKKLGMLEYNNIFHARDMIRGRIEILKTFASPDSATADLQKELETEKVKEIKDIQAFVSKKAGKTQSSASGVLVEIQNAGDAVKADSGMQAKLMYRGSFVGGKQFDTNMDPKRQNNQPLTVDVGTTGGQHSVIKGLDEGLHFFGKGGKGKIYIPAMLGYGQNGQPPIIPAYSNLVFEIEVLDVSVPPPQPSMPKMPPQAQKKK